MEKLFGSTPQGQVNPIQLDGCHTLDILTKKGDTKRMFDTIIVVTDRTVLDDQLRNTIRSLEKIDGVVSGVEHGSQELKKFLEQGKDNHYHHTEIPFISETIASLGDRTLVSSLTRFIQVSRVNSQRN